jgi:hypothetical protein
MHTVIKCFTYGVRTSSRQRGKGLISNGRVFRMGAPNALSLSPRVYLSLSDGVLGRGSRGVQAGEFAHSSGGAALTMWVPAPADESPSFFIFSHCDHPLSRDVSHRRRRRRCLARVLHGPRHCLHELVYYGPEIFELAETRSGDLSDPAYIAARINATAAARLGIDSGARKQQFGRFLAPHLTSSTGPTSPIVPFLQCLSAFEHLGDPAILPVECSSARRHACRPGRTRR